MAERISYEKYFLNWEDINTTWETVDMIWEDISILIEIKRNVGGSGSAQDYEDYVRGNPWKKLIKQIGEEKTERAIKLYCNFKGIEYNKSKIINEKIKVSASDFQMFVEEGIRESIKIKVNF